MIAANISADWLPRNESSAAGVGTDEGTVISLVRSANTYVSSLSILRITRRKKWRETWNYHGYAFHLPSSRSRHVWHRKRALRYAAKFLFLLHPFLLL